MPGYEFTKNQVQNLKAIIMGANIKGSEAKVIVELIKVLEHPVEKVQNKQDSLERSK